MTGKTGSWETRDNALTFMLNSLRNTTELPLPAIDARAVAGLKFAKCLPADLAASVVQSRLADLVGFAEILGQPVRIASA